MVADTASASVTAIASDRGSQPEHAVVSEKSQTLSSPAAVAVSPELPAAAPRCNGVLRNNVVNLSRESGELAVIRQITLNGVPLAAIMFLDIANSADFPANVFNELPVPLFAQILMAIGGTFALVMAVFALTDARRSWRLIKVLCQEHKELKARINGGEKALDPSMPSFLFLNRRDFGTEMCERFGMEMCMGSAALIISAGIYLAIGGDNPKCYDASNLLSGYIGNAPACLYGVINAIWSCAVFNRAKCQRRLTRQLQGTQHARIALERRARMIQYHALFSGVVCLISGALGVVTATRWEPYPALAVFGLMFVYTVHLFRRKIAYVRVPLTQFPADFKSADLVHEIDQLLGLRVLVLEDKESAWIERDAPADRDKLESKLRLLTLLGLLERFCTKLLKSAKLAENRTSSLPALVELLSAEGTTEATQTTILDLADSISTSAEPDGGRDIYQALDGICSSCLSKKAVLEGVSTRTKLLLELLGSHLMMFPNDTATFQQDG